MLFNIFKLFTRHHNWASSLTTRGEVVLLIFSRLPWNSNHVTYRELAFGEKLRKRLVHRNVCLICSRKATFTLSHDSLQSKYWQKYHLRDRTNEIERTRTNPNERSVSWQRCRREYLIYSFHFNIFTGHSALIAPNVRVVLTSKDDNLPSPHGDMSCDHLKDSVLLILIGYNLECASTLQW